MAGDGFSITRRTIERLEWSIEKRERNTTRQQIQRREKEAALFFEHLVEELLTKRRSWWVGAGVVGGAVPKRS